MESDKKRIWFRRKAFGWGWSPATWEGWLVTLVYAAIVTAAALSVDDHSSAREWGFTFFIPVAVSTAALIRIACAHGESPRWQWGRWARKEGEGNQTEK